MSAVCNELPLILENGLTVKSRGLFQELYEELELIGELLKHCDNKSKGSE